tara:strand:+ start:28234 stop:29154 length:921 start_codon:yes stop_codon:yes gene_type:complete
MTITDEGKRRVFFHRRQLNEERAAQGDPLVFDVIPRGARLRLVMLVDKYFGASGADGYAQGVIRNLRIEFERPAESYDLYGSNGPVYELCDLLDRAAPPRFLSGLEAVADGFMRMHRKKPKTYNAILSEFQAVLAEEYVGYRFRWNSNENHYNIERIDNPHLHAEIVDRTFELTGKHAFSGAQHAYSEARGHYSKGEFADAIFKSGKAYESALKAILDKVGQTYDKESAAALAQLVIDNGVISTRLQTFLAALRNMMTQGPNTLRNQEGIGHGSADLVGPEASLANLVLNLTGSLIVFLVEEWERK